MARSYDLEDTIAAIASAPGGALRGIVRVSGPQLLICLDGCFTSARSPADVRHPSVLDGQLDTGEPLGKLPCQLLYWPDERSYTRQPSAEVHLVGSPPLLDAVLAALLRSGARLAEPGEFTLRAFMAGRLDLTRAEAVLGVIDAGNHSQLQVALAQLAGGLATPLDQLRNQLLDLLAHLEAGLDFVEEDIEFISAEQLDAQVADAAELVERIERQMSERDEAVVEPRVVLRGLPNVGKSSLLNALAGDDAALVSDVAGTTRDYVAKRTCFDGVECLLIDTAGAEPGQPSGSISLAAQQQMAEQMNQAQLQLLCLDASRPLDPWEGERLAEQDVERLVVWTKCDEEKAALRAACSEPSYRTSSRTHRGLDELRRAIARRLAESVHGEAGVVAGTAQRCRESLRGAAASLRRARRLANQAMGEELVAAELRVALDELGRVVGAVYTDDVLDRIFSRFCIGK